MTKTEWRLYNPIKNALKINFSDSDECYFENTSPPRRFSDRLKRQLDDDSLFILNIEKNFPDLTGYVLRKTMAGEIKEVIVVEVKEKKPTLKDIYQTKRYAEILKASYGLLISLEKLSVEHRRFLIKRREITQFLQSKHILIGQFNKSMKSIQIDNELYHDSQIPEPFR